MLPYEKVYVVTGDNLENKEIAVLQLMVLDETSSPNLVKTVVARLALSDYLALGVVLNKKVKVTITVVPDETKLPQV